MSGLLFFLPFLFRRVVEAALRDEQQVRVDAIDQTMLSGIRWDQ
ncbi:MAG: hypothetical protein ACREV9_13340 [Burkholderiales bacterium]